VGYRGGWEKRDRKNTGRGIERKLERVIEGQFEKGG
jgi:hypothetical protein